MYYCYDSYYCSYGSWYWCRSVAKESTPRAFAALNTSSQVRKSILTSEIPLFMFCSRILNDTSLAASIVSNGDRHLFFQDSTGNIRRAVRTTAAGYWGMTAQTSNTSSARNHTPLSVTVERPSDGALQV